MCIKSCINYFFSSKSARNIQDPRIAAIANATTLPRELSSLIHIYEKADPVIESFVRENSTQYSSGNAVSRYLTDKVRYMRR